MKKTLKKLINVTLACLLLANVVLAGNVVDAADNNGSTDTHNIVDAGEIH